MKREDMIPLSFGGNKARKAQLFFEEIDRGGFNCVVTYGSSSSNHCRIVANMAAQRDMPCYIVSPEEASEETFNAAMMRLFGAEITVCPVERVAETIDALLAQLRNQGLLPYFIPGGGHGNVGTQAYVNCYEEIRRYEKSHGLHFDYIFFASGTGTTHAGLVCGQLINREERKIVGISIARKNPRGRNVVIESIKEYLNQLGQQHSDSEIEAATIFLDDYVGLGYGNFSKDIEKNIDTVMKKCGIPLDTTYTGKAFWGMTEHLKNISCTGKNILFIHTGGTPLFFEHLMKKRAKEVE